MPPRSETLPAGIERMTSILAHLKSSPSLKLTGLKCLRLTLASQNDHFGARHFVKENLPQIRWANPDLDIQVHRERKSKSEEWKAEMELEFNTGKVQKVDINNKLSTAILKQLMDTAGGDPWKRHVQDCEKTGQPLFNTEETEDIKLRKAAKTFPSLEEFLAKHPEKKAEHVRKESSGKKPPKKTSTKKATKSKS